MKVSEKDYQLYSSRVAWYYFKAGMTQAEIAEKLGLNRSRVINILNEARRDGTVSIHVQGKDAKLAKLEEALKKIWNLREVMVIPKVADKQLKENLSIAGAHFLETFFDQRGGLVGLGWGHTIWCCHNHSWCFLFFFNGGRYKYCGILGREIGRASCRERV